MLSQSCVFTHPNYHYPVLSILIRQLILRNIKYSTEVERETTRGLICLLSIPPCIKIMAIEGNRARAFPARRDYPSMILIVAYNRHKSIIDWSSNVWTDTLLELGQSEMASTSTTVAQRSVMLDFNGAPTLRRHVPDTSIGSKRNGIYNFPSSAEPRR